jgi:multiple sugar transport system substrate-binding protein
MFPVRHLRPPLTPGTMKHSKALAWLVFAAGMSVVTGCSGEKSDTGQGRDRVTVNAWVHSGRAAERATVADQVNRFNASQDRIRVIPEGAYNAQVQAAAAAGELPDVLEFDGPFLYNYIWQGRLTPIGKFLPASVTLDLLPSIVQQGTYDGKLYSLGAYDSGLGIYARRSALRAVQARIPAGPTQAWTVREFEDILHKLAGRDPDGRVLDLKLSYTGEWFTYAFSPTIQSAGGDLIRRSDYRSAAGMLNGKAAVAAMTHIQDWIKRGYVDPDVDDDAFVAGRVALSWAGHWEYRRYAAAHGDDLVLVPLPDFGTGSKTGQGSWNWGVTRRAADPQAAAIFVRFLLRPDEVLRMTAANGAVPATRTAIARSNLYGPKGPLRLFAEQLLQGYAVPRPRTPAYPVITSAFQQAFADIRDGADVQKTLDRAVAVIDQDIRDNKGYPQQ